MKNKLNVLSLICIGISFLLLVVLYFFNILPFKYYIIGVIFMILLNVLSVVIVNRRSNILKVLGVLLLVLLTTFSGFGIYFVNNTNKLLNSIGRLTEKSVYYVVVNKNSKYNKIKDLKDGELGVIKDNKELYLKAIEDINKDVDINVNYYSKLPGMYNDLLSDQILWR